jgi:hypothetical protein
MRISHSFKSIKQISPSQAGNGVTMTSLGLAALLILLLSCCLTAVSQEIKKEKLGQFIGSWEGSGKLFGKPAKFQLIFTFALNDKFFHLEFRNEYSVDSRTYVMDAKAYYAVSQVDSLRGYWFDSRGVQQPVRAGLSPSTLTSLWGSPQTELGKTIYELTAVNELKVTDLVQRNGTYAVFGEAVYKRIR